MCIRDSLPCWLHRFCFRLRFPYKLLARHQSHSELIFPRRGKFIRSQNPFLYTCNARVQNEPYTCEITRIQGVIKPRNVSVMYDGLVAGSGKTQNFSPVSTKWVLSRRKHVMFVCHLFSVITCDFWHLLNMGRPFIILELCWIIYNPGITLKMYKSINYWW